jgi:hypothetical protein
LSLAVEKVVRGGIRIDLRVIPVDDLVPVNVQHLYPPLDLL